MTQDGLAGVSIAYNHLNLPGKITRNGGTLVKYSYLADGSKASALKGNGEGLVYRGSLIYRRASDGTLSLESAAFAEGMLTPEGVHYHVTDHLGSVRAVVDGESGAFLEAGKYDAYGSREEQMTEGSSDTTLRWHFTGKEDQGPDFGTAYTDFGARQYSPALRRWLVPDPLSEKYYDVSPYVYCNDNPVNMVDPDGKSTWVMPNEDGTYRVVGGDLNDGSLDVFVVSGSKEVGYTPLYSIGETAFSMSFYNSDQGKWAENAVINLNDSSGNDFLDSINNDRPGFLSYMFNAQNGKMYDFKVTNGEPTGKGYNPYRGMMLGGMIVSARDVGNIAAGYISGLYGVSYSVMRFLFDSYQSFSETSKINMLKRYENPYYYYPSFIISKEGASSTIPQKYGWSMGVLSRIRK